MKNKLKILTLDISRFNYGLIILLKCVVEKKKLHKIICIYHELLDIKDGVVI